MTNLDERTSRREKAEALASAFNLTWVNRFTFIFRDRHNRIRRFSAIATTESDALRVLMAEHPGVTAEFICVEKVSFG